MKRRLDFIMIMEVKIVNAKQAYSYMQNKETTILGKRQSDISFKANGIKAQIKLRDNQAQTLQLQKANQNN